MYDALGVALTEVGESFYNPMIAPTLEVLTQVLYYVLNVHLRVVYETRQ